MDHSLALVPPLQCCVKSDSSWQGSINDSVPPLEVFKQLLDSPSFAMHRPENRLITRSLFSELFSATQHRDSSNSSSKARIRLSDGLDLSKFHISPRPTVLFGKDIPSCCTSHPHSLLKYDNRIVAVDDLLYDILRFCHLASRHGDQEATNALVQEHYAFVPVDLVAKFVKACPGCGQRLLSEKAGDVVTGSKSTGPSVHPPIIRNSPSSQAQGALTQPSTVVDEEGETDEGDDLVRYLHLERTVRSAPSKIELPLMSTRSAPGVERPAPSMTGSMERLMSLPMSREVSLYQGIPNGWQYHFPDYESALNGFVKQMDEPPPEAVVKRKEVQKVPRIPSVAPLSRDRINNTLCNGIGDGSELFERGPVVLVEKEIVQKPVHDDLLDRAFAQIDQFSASVQVCKENTNITI
ncbi:hypothetical protein PM082_019060 [Marasmius tenuissimus]|nr:hypothetical protein PM082_019060 [Marasmius tenuissimus]